MSRKRRRVPDTDCAHCGAPVPAGRLACPECGSDAETGWKSDEEIDYEAVELPGDEHEAAAHRPLLTPRRLLLVAFVLVVAYVLAFVL